MTAGKKIPADVRELIYGARYCRSSIVAIAEFLPANDQDLDTWLAEAVAEQDPFLFTYLAIATASQDRPFAACHLERGLGLVPNETLAE